MTTAESLPPRLNDLLSALCENTIEDHEFDELQQQLARDPAALRAYIDYLDLHASLPRQFSAIPPTTEANLMQPAVPPVQATVRRSFWMTGSSIIAACLVALVFYGGFVLLAWNLRPDRLSSAARGNDVTVATVSGSADVRWSPEAFPKNDTAAIRSGEPLKIESGTVEFELKAGTKLVVEGPAEWSIDDSNSVSLRVGKLFARVPQQAIGFRVETPRAKIVDLGTEFGVQVDDSGCTDVQVLKGAVDVDYSSQTAERKPAGRSLRMVAGNTKRFVAPPGTTDVTVTEIAPWLDRTTRIVKRADRRETLPAETKYAAAVLADRPLGYWRFSDGGNLQATDVSSHQRHGIYSGFVSTTSPGINPRTNDRCVHFLGSRFRAEVKIDDVELPPAFTIELWARSTNPDWNTCGWLVACTEPYGLLVHPNKDARTCEFYVVDTRGTPKSVASFTPESISDRLHHYVCAFDSLTDHGWLYFDGALVGERNGVLAEKPRTEAVKRNFHVGVCPSPSPAYDFGEGWIDELAMYPRVLSAEEVGRHFTIGSESAEDANSPTTGFKN